MAEVGSIYSSVKLDTSAFEAGLRKIVGVSSDMSAKVQANTKNSQAAFDQTTKSINGMSGAMSAFAGIISSGAIIALGANVLDTAGKFEKYEVILKTTLGTSQRASEAMTMIKDIAAKTPFSVDELTASYIKLANRGLKPTEDEIVKLGDIAASQGKSFDQLTEAVLDATGKEFERLKEFGIKASSAGDQVTFSFKGVQKTVKDTPEAIQAALLSFGEMNGVVGGMAAISETLKGKLSNLGDATDSLSVSIGNAFLPTAKNIVDIISKIISSITGWIKDNPVLANTVIQVSAAIAALLVVILGIVPAISAIIAIMPALAASLAVGTGGLTLIAAAAVAATAAFIAMSESSKKTGEDFANSFEVGGGKLTETIDALEAVNNQLQTSGQASIATMEQLEKAIGSEEIKKFKSEGLFGTSVDSGAIEAALDKLKQRKEDLMKVDETKKPLAPISKGAKEALVSIEQLAAIIKQVRSQTDDDIKVTIETEATDKALEGLKKLKRNMEILGEQAGIDTSKIISDKISTGGDLKKKTLKIDLEIPKDVAPEVADKLRASFNDLSKTLKVKATVETKIDKEKIKEVSAGMFDPLVEAASAASKEIEKFFASKSGQMVKGVLNGIGQIAQQFTALLSAQADLAKAKFANFQQNLSFMTSGLTAIIDAQGKEAEKGYARELSALDEQKKSLLDIERQYEIDRQAMKLEFDTQAKAAADEKYNAAVAILQTENEKQIEYIERNAGNEEQRDTQKEFQMNDFEQRKLKLRQDIDSQTVTAIANNDKALDDQAKKKSEDIKAREAAIDAQKTAVEDKKQKDAEAREAQKQDLQKKSKLFEWVVGRSSFELEKRAKIAAAQMAIAQGIVNAISSSMQLGPIAGPILAGVLTTMVLTTGAMSISAINASQYPPPPVFAEGGIVGGALHSAGGTMVNAEAGELIVPRRNFDEVINSVSANRSGGMTTNIYMDGVSVSTGSNWNADQIADRVGQIIRQRTYQAVVR